MVRIATLVSLVFAIAVAARPLPLRAEGTSLEKRAFTPVDYAVFQISDGETGNAKAKADKVFIAPFAGRNLADVTADELDAVQTMREAAEAAETEKFNPQIKAA
ncbi:hypothetical protein FRC12_012294, partial [Ceratobasidium sp. 428]